MMSPPVPRTRIVATPAARFDVPALAVLPRLDGIPSRISMRPERAEWADLALWCDDAGLVEARHWKQAYNAEGVVLAALSDWATRAGQLSTMGCSLSIQIAEGELEYGTRWSDVLAARNLNQDKRHLAVTAWSTSNPRNFTIGRRLTELNEECPGLAAAALDAIREAAINSVDVIDPARVFYLACCFYWYGEEDEALALEEMGGEEEAGDYIVRRSQFDDYAPEWVWKPTRTLSGKALATIAKDGKRTELARHVAAACLEIRRAVGKTKSFNPYEGLHEIEFIGHGALLWWDDREHDPMVRVLDDYEQRLWQGDEGYLESFGIDVFEASREGFMGWLKQKKQWFDLARKLDVLVGLVGEEIRNESN